MDRRGLMSQGSRIPAKWGELKERRNADSRLNLIDARALEVGDLAHQLVFGCHSSLAAMTVASDPQCG